MADNTPIGDRPEAGRYEIRLTGHLDARWSAWFDLAGTGPGTPRVVTTTAWRPCAPGKQTVIVLEPGVERQTTNS